MTLATFNFLRNIPALKTCFINTVKDFIIFGAICFSKLVEMPSIPVLFLDGRLFIVFCTISSSTLLSVNLQLTFLFKVVLGIFIWLYIFYWLYLVCLLFLCYLY